VWGTDRPCMKKCGLIFAAVVHSALGSPVFSLARHNIEKFRIIMSVGPVSGLDTRSSCQSRTQRARRTGTSKYLAPGTLVPSSDSKRP
jgi:hypothetical protein